MKRPPKTIPLLISFFLLLPTTLIAAQFKVTRVSDGDSVKTEGCDIVIMVRLARIDAPETSRKKGEPGQPFSQRDRRYLAGLILNKVVDIRGRDRDRYPRLRAL